MHKTVYTCSLDIYVWRETQFGAMINLKYYQKTQRQLCVYVKMVINDCLTNSRCSKSLLNLCTKRLKVFKGYLETKVFM